MNRVAIALLALWLWAPSALAQNNPVQLCEEDCTNNTGVELRTCMDACPFNGNGKDRAFVKCATQCAAKYNQRVESCKARCNGQPDPHAEKKSKAQPLRKHSDDE